MIFKYDYRTINGNKYIARIKLISEFGQPDWILEENKSRDIDFFDANNKLQWVIKNNPLFDPSMNPNEENRPYNFEKEPQLLTVEETTLKRKEEFVSTIWLNFTLADLLEAAFEALDGKFDKVYSLKSKYEGLKNDQK